MNNNIFSKIPKVDQLLTNVRISELEDEIPREIIVESIREELEILREEISKGNVTLATVDERIEILYKSITFKAKKKASIKLKKVINGTGVVIHTNLGRSLISRKIIEHISEIATSYSNLEFDLEKGTRGSRYSHLEDIIMRITGAESALVVNNNAAAVMLVLSSLAKNKEVIVSRGELVEIGGSFRVPDVMEQSGAKLVDVGTTNKTHLWDYEKAIGEDTAALLKVHTSNYRILGFTSKVELDELVVLGRERNIPVIEDLGSGVLVDLSKYGLDYEPTVQDSISQGVDIVTFSGDKLLGGPQAGIIVGKKKYIDMMKKHPLTRAFRVDKFTIAALEATLRLYLDEEEAIRNIPTLAMLTMPIKEIERKAIALYDKLQEKVKDTINIEVVDQISQVGGGSMPLEELPTKAIMIHSENMNISKLESKLRNNEIPVITRVYKDRMYIDVRTIEESDFNVIISALEKAINRI